MGRGGWWCGVPVLLLWLAFHWADVAADNRQPVWTSLQKGVAYATLPFAAPAPSLDGYLHVVKIDPAQAQLTLKSAAQTDRVPRSAGQWSREFGLVATINAGMYATDLFTNVGYLRSGRYRNNPHWNASYKAALGIGCRINKKPRAFLADLDVGETRKLFDSCDGVVQNLRLLKDPGVNMWSLQERQWSEAAVADDREGNILLLFCQTPLMMNEFNEKLRASPLGVRRAMHMEGGHQASLSIHAANLHLDLAGVTGLLPGSTAGTAPQYPLPNVLGVVAAAAGKSPK